MTALPPTYYLHVWWARRPLVASRAAVLASLLPADADREKFLHVLGIHGDPIEAKRRIAIATQQGNRLGKAAYGYPRAFRHNPDEDNKEWLTGNTADGTVILDPTSGGGSIPFESVRLGIQSLANDLNPVAALILKATIEWPASLGIEINNTFQSLGRKLTEKVRIHLEGIFPEEIEENTQPDGYLWARTVICPYCSGLVPLSPNWRLTPNGTGVRLVPDLRQGPGSNGRICSFEIVETVEEQSLGTVTRGDGTCPYQDCGRVIDGDEIKQQAQDGNMGEQLYTVVFKKRVPGKILKSGKTGRDKWVRGYRAPRPDDDNSAEIATRLDQKLPEWEALNIIPSEKIPEGLSTSTPRLYGMELWRDMFSPRQLLCHGTSVEVFREMIDSDQSKGELTEVRKAAYGYLALSLDKLLNFNSRMSVWHPAREVVANTFNRHDFAIGWSHSEMALLIVGLGYDWAIQQTAKCIQELVNLISSESKDNNPKLLNVDYCSSMNSPAVKITCKSGDNLDHITDGSVDAIVMDPPYYDNVMYAELSDFFYVWLKRTAGHVFPEMFRRNLTDKDNEAVANVARFKGKKGAKVLAGLEYQDRMTSIFAECHRVLKSDGIMTLMFTHKATGAWDALTKGLMEAGFVITASWPINTEAEGSLHIRNKAAANSTIFLACRPRTYQSNETQAIYWEDVEPQVAQAVRKRIGEYQNEGITGVDLYLASFGPALEEFSRHWPLKRGTPQVKPKRKRGQKQVSDDGWDPYAATPEDALNAARQEVKRWRLEQLTQLKSNPDLDSSTAFFVLAWDAFKAPVFFYDEALRLAHAVGADLDRDIVGRVAGKKGSNLHLWDSTHRAANGSLGPADGSRGMIDAIHHAANLARTHSLDSAKETLAQTEVDRDPKFTAAFTAVLEVLPVSSEYTGIDLKGEVEAAGSDFEALYKLSRLAYSDRVEAPKQLQFWQKNEL